MSGNKEYKTVQMGNFNESVYRKFPNLDDYQNWASSFLNLDIIRDFDVYLWGSFPEKKTADIDIMLVDPNLQASDSDKMEEIFLLNLYESLVERNIWVDLGMSTRPPGDHRRAMDMYLKTGRKLPTNSFSYGGVIKVDGEIFKDKMDGLLLDEEGNKGYVVDVGNNVLQIQGAIPTVKMLKDMDNGLYHIYYGGKPVKIKDGGIPF